MSMLRERARTALATIGNATKTDVAYLAKGGFWLTAGYSFQVVSGLILTVAFANLLPKETFGTYQFILSMAAIASVFTLTGMGTALMRAGARGEQGSLRFGVRTQLVWSAGIVLSSFAFSLYYFVNGNGLLGTAFLIVAACQPLITGFGLYKWYLHGRQLFRESVIVETLQRMVPFASLLVTIFVTDDALTIVAVYFISNALSFLGAYLFVLRHHRLPVTQNPELRSYSKHLSVMESFAEIASVADKILVWAFLGGASLAAYALAQMPSMHLQTVFGFIRSLTFSKLAQKSMPELQNILPRRIWQYTVLVMVVVGLYVIAAPTLFAIFFPAYPEAVLFSQVFALSVLAVPRSLIGQAFAAHERKRELYIVNISTPTVRIILLSILLPLLGIWGAIAAVVITELYAAVIQLYLFRRAR